MENNFIFLMRCLRAMKYNYLDMEPYVPNNEILEDAYFIDNEWFYRYYHKNNLDKPTRIFGSKSGRIWRENRNKIVHGTYDKDGYLHLSILISKNKKKHLKNHRVICMIFHPESYNDELQVNHINGIKDDNRAENLEWCTNLENIKHSCITGLSPAFKYPDEIIHKMCKMLKYENKSMVEVSKELNIPLRVISSIVVNKSSRQDIAKVYEPFPDTIYIRIQDNHSDEIIHKMCKMLKYENKSMSEVSKELNIPYNTIFDLINHKDKRKDIINQYKPFPDTIYVHKFHLSNKEKSEIFNMYYNQKISYEEIIEKLNLATSVNALRAMIHYYKNNQK